MVGGIVFTLRKYNHYLPVIKNFFAYAVGNAILRAVTAVIAFMNLHVFTLAQFGVLGLVNSFVGMFPNFLNWGIRQAFGLEYFHLNSISRRIMLNHAIIIYLLIAIPLLTICLFNIPFINQTIFLNQATKSIIFVALIYCFIQFFSELYLQVLRYQMRAGLLTFVQLGAAVLSIATNIFLVFYLGWGILGAVCANTIGILAISVWAFWQYFSSKTHCFLPTTQVFAKTAQSLLITGFPFIPNILFTWILSSGNRWLLAHLTNTENAGIYTLADMVGQIFNLCILYPMSGSYIPYMLQQFTEKPNSHGVLEQQNQKFMWIAMVVMTFLVSIATVAAFWIGPSILPKSYLGSLNYIWFILMGYVFMLGTYFSSCYLLYYKKTWLLLGITVSSALTNIMLNFLFIPFLSIYGSVLASLVAYILFFVLNILATNKLCFNVWQILLSRRHPDIPNDRHAS